MGVRIAAPADDPPPDPAVAAVTAARQPIDLAMACRSATLLASCWCSWCKMATHRPRDSQACRTVSSSWGLPEELISQNSP